MTEESTWAGLDYAEHARKEIEKAKSLADFPKGVSFSYRLKVVDDDIDSESGILFESRFADPEAAASYTRTHSRREYDYGLYEIRPVRSLPVRSLPA